MTLLAGLDDHGNLAEDALQALYDHRSFKYRIKASCPPSISGTTTTPPIQRSVEVVYSVGSIAGLNEALSPLLHPFGSERIYEESMLRACPSVLNIRVRFLVVPRPLRVGAATGAEGSDLFGWR